VLSIGGILKVSDLVEALSQHGDLIVEALEMKQVYQGLMTNVEIRMTIKDIGAFDIIAVADKARREREEK